jgi:hypothetical protein
MTFILLPFWTGCPLSVTESAVEGVRQPDAATNTVWHVDFQVQPPGKWLLTFPLVLTTLIGRSSMSPDCAVESPSKSAKAVPESALNSRQPRPSARKFWRNGCAFIIQLRVKLRGQPSRNLNSASRLAYGSTVGGKGDKESFWTIPTTLRSPCLQCRFVRFGQSLARFCHSLASKAALKRIIIALEPINTLHWHRLHFFSSGGVNRVPDELCFSVVPGCEVVVIGSPRQPEARGSTACCLRKPFRTA